MKHDICILRSFHSEAYLFRIKESFVMLLFFTFIWSFKSFRSSVKRKTPALWCFPHCRPLWKKKWWNDFNHAHHWSLNRNDKCDQYSMQTDCVFRNVSTSSTFLTFWYTTLAKLPSLGHHVLEYRKHVSCLWRCNLGYGSKSPKATYNNGLIRKV